MLITSKDAGSHVAGVPDPGGTDSVGTSGSSWEMGEALKGTDVNMQTLGEM